MEHTYTISRNEEGQLAILCPVEEIIPLRKELRDILRKEIEKAAIDVLETEKRPTLRDVGRRFHCSPVNIQKILKTLGWTREYTFCKEED